MIYKYDGQRFFGETAEEIKFEIKEYLNSLSLYIDCCHVTLGPERIRLGSTAFNENYYRLELIRQALRNFSQNSILFKGKTWCREDLKKHLECKNLRFLSDDTFSLDNHLKRFKKKSNCDIDEVKNSIIEEILNKCIII